jgi:hypothetical protein
MASTAGVARSLRVVNLLVAKVSFDHSSQFLY